LARSNRNITNPTGLVLATVPQSFAGQTFLEFRQRREEQARLAAEDQRRRLEEQEGLREWVRQDRERQEAILNNPAQSQESRDIAERRLRQMADWTP
jgi:flagellar biosynthesis/type III secretory pathway M-ring protein FliF/YscJ